VPKLCLTSHWSRRPTQQAFFGFFGIIAGGPPLTGSVSRTEEGETMSTPQVFLSHAGEDADLALRLASRIRDDLSAAGCTARVFNTSSPEDRFRDFVDVVAAGERWDPAPWEEDLREYLKGEIDRSVAYLLLVTPTSLSKSSRWIQFEIDTACDAQSRADTLFIPCVAEGAHLSALPPQASRFQGIDLSDAQGWSASSRAHSLLIGILADRIHRRHSGDSEGPDAG
jgi:hypothetical protein